MKNTTLENGFGKKPCEILPPTDDWVFKLLFGDERNKSMLIDLLKSFVELPEEEFELTFMDTHLKKEFEDDKLGILDIKLKTASGKIINIEIQVDPQKHIGKRLSYYKSKLFVEQIKEGNKYAVIQKVICICITTFSLFPEKEEYLNIFRFYNPNEPIEKHHLHHQRSDEALSRQGNAKPYLYTTSNLVVIPLSMQKQVFRM